MSRGPTYTYVFMQVSKRTYDEIKKKLLDAGYEHALQEDSERGTVLDMHGIALAKGEEIRRQDG